MDFTVTYISNSGFILETGSHVIVFDYQGDQPDMVSDSLLKKGKKLVLMASHSHGDHFSPQILRFAGKENAAVLLSDDIRGGAGAQYIGELEEKEVLGLTVEAYGSTDMGVSFMVNIDGRRIFHAGDFNLWHWLDESTQEEIKEARSRFDGILQTIKGPIDIAFFPVDPRQGSLYDLGADIFIEKFRPQLFFPMHFRGSAFAAIDFADKHSAKTHGTKIIPLTKAGDKYGGSI